MTSPCTSLPLPKLQELVGGYIETVPHFKEYEGEKCVAFCDEEGKLKGHKINAEATKIWYNQPEMVKLGDRRFQDYLVGVVVIVQGADLLRKL